MLLAGQAVLRLLVGQLRAQARQGGAARVDRGLLHAGVDLGQQLAFFHGAARLHVQARDLARHLRAHVDIGLRLQGADGRDAGLDIAALDGRRVEHGGRAARGPQRAGA